MDVTIIYLGSSLTLTGSLSVEHVREVTNGAITDTIDVSPAFSEDDLPPDWTNFNPIPGRLVFPGKAEVKSK